MHCCCLLWHICCAKGSTLTSYHVVFFPVTLYVCHYKDKSVEPNTFCSFHCNHLGSLPFETLYTVVSAMV